MTFWIDHHLPITLAVHLRRHGHKCACVADLGMSEATDLTIWNAAQRDGAILISKDEDFIILVSRPDDQGRLIWVRLGNCRNAVLHAAFDRVHDELVLALQSGRRVFELR